MAQKTSAAKRFGVISPRGILLSAQEFESLPDYSCTLPTGTTIGRRWRRRTPYMTTPDAGPWEFHMGEYVVCKTPGMVGIEWTKIILPDGYLPREFRARGSSDAT